MVKWRMIVGLDIDVDIEADFWEEAMAKAREIVDKINIPHVIVDGRRVSVDLDLVDVMQPRG